MTTSAHASSCHASMVVIDEVGVMMTGASSSGKSELCLTLIDRGHRFVADDMVSLSVSDNRLLGAAVNTHPQLAIRDVGIIDINQRYGAQSCLSRHPINLVVELSTQPPQTNPLLAQPSYKSILDIDIPHWQLSVQHTAPLPLLVELLARARNKY